MNLDDKFDDTLANQRCPGHIAFDAYCSAKDIDGTAHTGRPIPPWSELPEHIRGAWVASVKAAIDSELASGRMVRAAIVTTGHGG